METPVSAPPEGVPPGAGCLAGVEAPGALVGVDSPASLEDEDGYCGVCGSAHSEEGDALLFCDGPGCGVAVHQLCYGIGLLPPEDEDWFCYPCVADRDAREKRRASESPRSSRRY